MKTNERKELKAALESLQLWFAGLPYGFSEMSPANAAMVATRVKVRDAMIEKLNK